MANITVTIGEALFIARSLKLLRNDIKQEIKMHGDDSGISNSHVIVLDKIIPKFNVSITKEDMAGKASIVNEDDNVRGES